MIHVATHAAKTTNTETDGLHQTIKAALAQIPMIAIALLRSMSSMQYLLQSIS